MSRLNHSFRQITRSRDSKVGSAWQNICIDLKRQAAEYGKRPYGTVESLT